MHRFTDNDGRQWVVRVTGGDKDRLRAKLDLNILDCLNQNLFARLLSDLELMVNALWVLCEKQAKESEVSAEQFAEAIFGDVFDDAGKALVDAIIDFFPPGQRAVLAKMWAKVQEANARAEAKGLTALDSEEIDATVDRLILEGEQEMKRRLNALKLSSGSVQESSA